MKNTDFSCGTTAKVLKVYSANNADKLALECAKCPGEQQ